METTVEHKPRVEKLAAGRQPAGMDVSTTVGPEETWGAAAGLPLFMLMAQGERFGEADEAYEREAEAMADRVTGGIDQPLAEPTPAPPRPQRQAEEEEEEEEVVQRRPEGNGEGSAALPAGLNGAVGGGRPLPAEARSRMEPGFGADFSEVRIHTGAQAADLSSRLGAQAFTYGRDIFFNDGKFGPGTPAGDHLLAHELTHILQQSGGARQEGITPIRRQVQRFIDIDIDVSLPDIDIPSLDDLREHLSDLARDHMPGYYLATMLAGYDPLKGASVEPSRDAILEEIFNLSDPWGEELYTQLQELEIVGEAYEWIAEQIEGLGIGYDRIVELFDEAWEEVSIAKGIDYNLGVIRRKFASILSEVISFIIRVADRVLQFIKDALLDVLRELAEEVPGYELLVMILGEDPLTGEPVEATTVEIIETFLLLIGAEQELEKMKETNALEETAAWIDEQLATFRELSGELVEIFSRLWNNFTFESLLDPLGVVNEIVTAFTPFATRVFDFASTVALKVLEFIKNALLAPLAEYANDIPGFHLLTVILGRNPLTDEEVPRNAQNLIRGFMGLIPGGEQKYQQLEETGMISQAASRIEALVDELGLTWNDIRTLFTDLWNSFSIEDLLAPLETYARVLATFGEPLRRILAFVGRIIMVLVEFGLRLMNFPIELVQQIIANALQAIEDIKNDPIGFLMNLLGAVKEGFSRFFNNILTHLLQGLTSWLFGQIEKAGITPPSDLSFQSILGLVLEILGISAERIWAKLAEKIGQERVDQIRSMIDRLVGIWSFVQDVMERGPIAIWEYIQERLSDLWDMVLQKAQEWIMTRIIERVVTKLLSMLDPTGIMAVINGFIAFYNAVESAIEYLREMLEIVNSFVAGVAEIARGQITRAASFLEGALADGLPVAIGFLANQVGLGNLGEKIQEIIEGIREVVDRALDWLIDKAVEAGTGLIDLGRRAVSAVRDWWNARKTFSTPDGADHALYFRDAGRGYVLYVQSEPQTYRAFINSLEIDGSDADKVNKKNRALALVGEVEDLIAASQAAEDVDNSAEIQAKLEALAPLTAELMAGPEMPIGTSSPPVFAGLQNGFGRGMRIEYLTETTTGTPASATGNETYDTLNQRRSGSGSYYIRGHLLSEKLHGTGSDWKNLTPLSRSGNALHESRVESRLKDAIDDGPRAFRYIVFPTYGRGVNSGLLSAIDGSAADIDKEKAKDIVRAEQHVPLNLVCTVVELDPATRQEKGDGLRLNDTVPNEIDQSGPQAYQLEASGRPEPILVNSAGIDELEELSGIGPKLAERIFLNRPYRTRTDMLAKVSRLPESLVNELYESGRISFA